MSNHFNKPRLNDLNNPFRESDSDHIRESKRPKIFDIVRQGSKIFSQGEQQKSHEGNELQYRGPQEKHFSVLKDIKDEDLEKVLKLNESKIDTYLIKKVMFENIIKGTEKDLKTAAEGSINHLERQLNILQKRVETVSQSLKLHEYLHDINKMIKCILWMRGHYVTEGSSENQEQICYADPKLLRKSIENTLELDKISNEIKDCNSQPDHILVDRFTRTINQGKFASLKILEEQKKNAESEERQSLLQLQKQHLFSLLSSNKDKTNTDES